MTIFFRVDVAASLFAILAGALHIGAYFGFWWSAPETGMELFWRVGVSVAIIFMEAFDGLTDPMALAHAVIGVFVVGELIRLPSLWWYLRQPA